MPRRAWIVAAASAGLLLSASWLLTHQALRAQQRPALLLAPMLELTDTCVLPGAANAQVPASLEAACTLPQTQGGKDHAPSAAALVAQTLAQLPEPAPHGPYALGYTLPIPLLQLYVQDAQGRWQIDGERLARYIHTLRDTPRPAVVYLFGTHFSAHAPLEPALARDAANLAHAQNGPLGVDDYMGSPLYPWSVARTDNTLTAYRLGAIEAVVDGICSAGQARQHVHAITLLGEVHQLFPHFATGAGFGEPYFISDYSPASLAQFRQYLQQRFGSLHALNLALHSAYGDWQEITPPQQVLQPANASTARAIDGLHNHLDAYAHGHIPVSGWTYIPDAQAHADSRILVYVDGRPTARLPIDQGRQDVLEAKPEFGHRVVGWQTLLDYRHWSSGEHQIDLYLHTPGQPLRQLASKRLSVATAQPHAAPWQPGARTLPRSVPAEPTLAHWVDLPLTDRLYLHNPLAEHWHAFRQQQVNNYLRHFAQVLEGTCLADVPLYLHQIVPHTNPGWDAQKFAIARSLRPQSDLQLGVSLYGEPGLSPAFVGELLAQGHRRYGITEFHPLKPLSPAELRATLDLHHRSGAGFFSFFLEPVWQQRPVERAINPFSLSPHNPHKGSDATFEALKQVLQE